MSLDINVYCKELSDDLIPKIIQRLNDYEMSVDIHPEFSFTTQTGFLSFKFRLTNSPLEALRNNQLISGFELYTNDFELQKEQENLKSKPRFIDKILGKKQPDVFYASPEIDNRLQECQKIITFNWGFADSFELRFASLFSAILTELTNGVCSYPADNIWYNNNKIVDYAYSEVKQHEELLTEKTVRFHEFEGWD
jgi:hypothetical protein